MSSSGYRIALLTEERPTAYCQVLAEQFGQQLDGTDRELVPIPVHWSDPRRAVTRNHVDEVLASAQPCQALILLSGVFSNRLRELSLLSQLWAPRPVASVSYRLPGIPSVILDNRAGVKGATEHLIVSHRRRNVLFIKGRADSQEAQERFLGYRSALKEHGILFREELAIQGDFTRDGGLRAISQVPKSVEFDAIMAANDEMALSALLEMQRRGRRVPEDVAVVGVDDIPEARRLGLASLAQPFDQVARLTLKTLEDQLAANSVRGVFTVPGRFMPRSSCGCGSRVGARLPGRP